MLLSSLIGADVDRSSRVRRRRGRRHHLRQPQSAPRLRVRGDRRHQGGRRALHRRCGRQGRRRRSDAAGRRGRRRRRCAGAARRRAAPRAGADGGALLRTAAARDRGRRDRHQRQDVGRRFHAADLRRARPQQRLARHHRPRQDRRRRLRLADDARSGLAARDAGRARRRGRHASGVRSLLARPRPAPARRRAAEGGGLHQPRPRPSRLSPDHRGLSRRQAAAVLRAAAGGRHGRRSMPTPPRARGRSAAAEGARAPRDAPSGAPARP